MKFLQGCKKELSALANRAIRLCKQLVCHVSAISNQSLNSKDKLLLNCLQCIFFWQLEINCFITEILHALQICYCSTVFLRILRQSSQINKSLLEYDTQCHLLAKGHNMLFIWKLLMRGGSPKHESQNYPAVCLLLFLTKHKSSDFWTP